MTDQPALTSPPRAVAGIRRLRDRLAKDHPAFAAAAEIESGAEAFCQAVRGDLRALREQRGLNQAALGEIMDMTQSAVCKIETGQGDIGLKSIYRFAEAAGCRPVLVFLPSAQALARHAEAEPQAAADQEAKEDPADLELAVRMEQAQVALLRSVSGDISEIAAEFAELLKTK